MWLVINLFKYLSQELTRVALLDLRHLARRALSHYTTACRTTLGTYINQMVGNLDHVQIMLDYNRRIASIDQLRNHLQQLLHVLEMEACRRLVEDLRFYWRER